MRTPMGNGSLVGTSPQLSRQNIEPSHQTIQQSLRNIYRQSQSTGDSITWIEKLHENMKDKEIQEVQQDWESLDKEIGRAMKIGEKALKKPSGRYSWSKTLRRAAYTQQYWKKRSKLHKYGIEETEALYTIREIAGINSRTWEEEHP